MYWLLLESSKCVTGLDGLALMPKIKTWAAFHSHNSATILLIIGVGQASPIKWLNRIFCSFWLKCSELAVISRSFMQNFKYLSAGTLTTSQGVQGLKPRVELQPRRCSIPRVCSWSCQVSTLSHFRLWPTQFIFHSGYMIIYCTMRAWHSLVK